MISDGCLVCKGLGWGPALFCLQNRRHFVSTTGNPFFEKEKRRAKGSLRDPRSTDPQPSVLTIALPTLGIREGNVRLAICDGKIIKNLRCFGIEAPQETWIYII